MLQATAPHFIPTKILVPVDFSSSSDAALETASDLALHFHAELYLLNVIPMLPMGAKTVSFPESEYIHKAEDNAERQLARVTPLLFPGGLRRVPASKLAMTWWKHHAGDRT
jgi:nucleotide-binding universal stress UspA family protein